MTTKKSTGLSVSLKELVADDADFMKMLMKQALHQVLSPIFAADFSEPSYGFRPGRSAHQAVKAAQRYVAEGGRVVVDMDLEKFRPGRSRHSDGQTGEADWGRAGTETDPTVSGGGDDG